MATTYLRPSEAKGRLSEFDVILDVRRSDEWESGHLELPTVRFVENLHMCPDKLAGLDDLKDKKVLVHCGMGVRARKVGDMLADKVANLFVVVDGGYPDLIK